MLNISNVHHIAIICSDYTRSKKFYTEVMGLKVLSEHYREERSSYKLDLALNDQYIIELFSFPDPPQRRSLPESTGLRHLAFETPDLDGCVAYLSGEGITTEPIRIDQLTGKRFTFFQDPDKLPLELYEK
jgi:glyoxylase I family protein